VFEANFTKGGGQILETLKVRSPMQISHRSCSAPPTCIRTRCFVFVPAGQAGTSLGIAERGLDKSGIRLVGPGDITDDDDLAEHRRHASCVVTAGIYSAAHPSALNQEYVAAYQKATGHRANFISVAAMTACT